MPTCPGKPQLSQGSTKLEPAFSDLFQVTIIQVMVEVAYSSLAERDCPSVHLERFVPKNAASSILSTMNSGSTGMSGSSTPLSSAANHRGSRGETARRVELS